MIVAASGSSRLLGTSSDSVRRASSACRASETSSSSRLEALGDLGDRRGSAQLVAQLRGRLVHRHRPLLEHRCGSRSVPDAVAEVAPKLAEDGRRRVGGERRAAVGIEAVQRLNQPEACDLDQVVERLGASAISESQGPCQRQKAPDQLLLQDGVAGRCVAAQKRLLIESTIPALALPREQ